MSTQVKKIMNQVFHSLRGEFELEESYNGRAVLGTIMNTIKVQPAVGCCTETGILLLKCLLRGGEYKIIQNCSSVIQLTGMTFIQTDRYGQPPEKGRSEGVGTR